MQEGNISNYRTRIRKNSLPERPVHSMTRGTSTNTDGLPHAHNTTDRARRNSLPGAARCDPFAVPAIIRDRSRKQDQPNAGDREGEEANTNLIHVEVYHQKTVGTWKLKLDRDEKKTVLVILDSNGRLWQCCNETSDTASWSVHCIPGARLSHVNEVLQRQQIPPNYKTCIIGVGVNNRDTVGDDLSVEILGLEHTMDRHPGVKFRFLTPSILPAQTKFQKGTLRYLTKMASDVLGHDKIYHVPPGTPLTPKDPAHYDLETTKNIVHNLQLRLRSSLN
jgi:hypothetical protein